MGEVKKYTSGEGISYKGGNLNPGGSHMIGWDNGSVRAEVYSFTTGSWPITHIKWYGPPSSVYQGSDIPVRYVIDTEPHPSYHGTSYGTTLKKNADNECDVNLERNTTYYFTFFPGVDRNSGSWGLLNFGYTPQSDNWFSVWSTEDNYSSCTAPTKITLSSTIQKPGQNVTLSWSGATAGNNLSIIGYYIYRSNSQNGSYTQIAYTSGTSYSVTTPSTRGDTYYYKIVTRSSYIDSSYNSPLSNASNGLKANTLPGAPTVSVNRSIVPSTGGSVTFTVTPGSDSDGQTLTLAYATSSGGTKTAFTSPSTVNFTQATTYYFYTYDGLEYSSSSTSQSITVNTKPSITNLSCAIGTYRALGGSGAENYQLGYANTITPTISTNDKIGIVTVELEYYSSNDTATWNSSSVSRIVMQQSTISSSSSVLLNSSNIHQYVTLGTTNVHWRIRLKLNDGIEDSDYVYFPTYNNGNTVYYAIARPSPLLDTFNQFSDSNITGTTAGQVWRYIRLKIYNDSSATNVSVTATANDSAITASAATSIDESETYRYVDVTIPDNLSGGATINITVQLKDSVVNTLVTKVVNATVTETKIPNLGNLTHGAGTIKPFTDTGAFNILTGWPFGSYVALDDTTLEAYNCSTTVSNAIRFVHSSSNSGDGANRVIKTLTWARNGDNITTLMNRQDAYGWEHELGISTYSGSRTYYCRIEIVNLFGKITATPWLSRTFNFKEKAQSVAISTVQWSEDATNWTTLGANDKIQEGIYLKFDCSFGLYTTDEVTVSILLDNNNSGNYNSVECYEYGDPTRITPVTYSNTELTRATDRTIKTNTKSYVYHITNEIADTTDRKWKVQVKNTGGTTNSSQKSTKVERQCAPTLVFNSCTIEDNYFTYAFTLTDSGFDTTNPNNSLTNYLWDGTDNATQALSDSSGTVQSILSTGWEVKTISVKSVSVVTGLITNTKAFYSNSIIVYQLAPTVAYRKNQLGINTKTPDSNATVDIHQASGKSTVLIQGVTTDGNLTPTKFELNVSTGEIKFYLYDTQNETYELKNTIDLLNGILS